MHSSESSPSNTNHTAAVIRELAQPLTVCQLAHRLGAHQDTCSWRLSTLKARGLVWCLNESARRSRVYGLTDCGRSHLRHHGIDVTPHDDTVDWALYGWVSFSHRTAVLLALDEPEYPSAIKRRARYQDPGVKLSANNVRDVIQLFLARGLVTPVHDRKRAHPRYALSAVGQQLRHQVLLARGPRQ